MPRSHVIDIAVFGAHLSGLPLNHELVAHGGVFVRRAQTTKNYRFYLLPGGAPLRPGLLRVREGQGASIEGEIWALTSEGFGRFVSAIPPPLTVGTVMFADDTTAKGFLVESVGVEGALDISDFGDWRAFLK